MCSYLRDSTLGWRPHRDREAEWRHGAPLPGDLAIQASHVCRKRIRLKGQSDGAQVENPMDTGGYGFDHRFLEAKTPLNERNRVGTSFHQGHFRACQNEGCNFQNVRCMPQIEQVDAYATNG